MGRLVFAFRGAAALCAMGLSWFAQGWLAEAWALGYCDGAQDNSGCIDGDIGGHDFSDRVPETPATDVSVDADRSAPQKLSPTQANGVRFIGNLRLRYEHADDDAQPQNANALTVRYRGTLELGLAPRLTVLGEVEAVGELVDNFNDGRLNWSSLSAQEMADRKFRPVIADPGGAELNRAQAVIDLTDTARTTIGRQRIVLDDERFVGVSAFRQNDRTFDAVRLNAEFAGGILVDGGYIRNARRVIRDDAGFGVFKGDSYFLNVNTPAPAGRLTVFHYALDLETGPAYDRSHRASTRTSGARLEGRRYWRDIGLLWQASYARQSDFADNPFEFSANYWLGEAGLEKDGFSVFGRSEILSGNAGSLGFSTPLATLRRFQGNADIFFVTPADGIVDTSVRGEWRLGSRGPFRDVQAFVRRHWFSAETTGEDYGVEVDAEVSATLARTSFSAGLALYRSNGFATDTDRVFVSVAHAF